MSKKHAKNVRAPTQARSLITWMASPEVYSQLTGYTRLVDNPEIQTALQHVAELVSCMTIHLMENSKDGDRRIKNELSRKIDISPCRYTTRKAWIEKTVKDMLEDGNSIAIPHFSGSLLDDIEPLPVHDCTIMDERYGYWLRVRGERFEHDEVLHFTFNPDPARPWRGRGNQVLLKNVAKQLARARSTSDALMSSPTPSIIVKVDGLTEEFASPSGRKKLAAQYLDDSENGRPWFIPAGILEVEQVKPLNLEDLAIIDSITLDKRMAAAIVGVPPYVVGVGTFDEQEHNNFVRTKLLPIALSIQQELTRKLLISPNWYFRLNPRSLYAYSLQELAEVDCNLVDRAIIDRNEARDDMGRSPRDGLSELAVLENYIPYAKIGEQNKLKGGKDDGSGKKENGNSAKE
ncbi:MAG: phage portal protein [Bacillota bacterium]